MMAEDHDIVVTQHYADRDFAGSDGANIHIGVVTSQKFGKAGIERELRIEVIQPQKRGSDLDEIKISKTLSAQDSLQFQEAADRLISVTDSWRSTPSPSRTSTEFVTPVVGGLALGRHTSTEKKSEYFLEASDEARHVRSGLGGIEQLNEFCSSIREAGNLIL